MQYRRLGSTDIEVSPVGLGTVKFGRNQGVKYPQAFELPSEKAVASLLDEARSLGINMLDTAPAYGSSEERLGKLLQGQRDEWVIVSKAGEEFIDGQSYFDFSGKAICQSVERSLKRLKTDFLDVILLHSDGSDKSIIENEVALAALDQLKKEGKIRAYGMSTKTIEGGLLTVDLMDVVMVTYNPGYTDEESVIARAHEKKKGVLIKKALASGHLKMPVKDTLQFIFNQPGVSSVIVGTLNPVHLRENVTGVTI